ncbi:MAG: helix-turn-helix domain-containing protein [Allosphingosinicella sp.]
MAVHDSDRVAVARLAGLFKKPRAGTARPAIHVVDGNGNQVELPEPLADILAHAATLMADGQQVSVIAGGEMLTTQGAAERLNVSRQYVVRLVDRGKLPAVKVGSHRRLHASDVEAFRARRDAERDAALDQLALISQEMGGYRLGR